MSRWEVKQAFTEESLLEGFDLSKCRGSWVKRYSKPIESAAKLFADCFYMILLDIIDNNVTFVLPLNCGFYAEIGAESFTGEAFKEVYNKGKFQDIDYVLSNFTGNALVCRYKTLRTKELRRKPIYVDRILKKKLVQHTHEGKQYY